MRADSPGEGRHDPAALEIKLGVTDLSLRIVHRGLRRSLVGGAMVDGLFCSERFSHQHLSTTEFAISERKPRPCCLQLGVGLGQPDLIGARLDGEEEIAFMDNVPILEVYSVQCAA